jgi:tetratricopeptide (TPR) repeat protein
MMMKFVSRATLGVALALGGLSLAVGSPASAQKPAKAAAPIDLKLSKEERAALAAVETALKANDAAATAAALAAAQPQIQSDGGRYAFGSMQVRLGLLNKDTKLQLEGLEAMTGSGKIPAAELPNMLQNQAALAFALKDYSRAETAVSRIIQLNPNDANATKDLGLVRINQKRAPEGLALLEKAISLQKASGQKVDENWYKFAFNEARKAKLVPQAVGISRDWLAAYPSPTNWRDTLSIYRTMTQADSSMTVDIYRLLRLQKALNSEADYYMLANALHNGGYPAEVKAVLDEGIAAKMVTPTDPDFAPLLSATKDRLVGDRASLDAQAKSALAGASGSTALKAADGYFGYGDYAKAIELYRAALQKGSVDANVVNTRLGMALALAGQKAEAEAAFKAVGGRRADLASYLLVWLQQRAA